MLWLKKGRLHLFVAGACCQERKLAVAAEHLCVVRRFHRTKDVRSRSEFPSEVCRAFFAPSRTEREGERERERERRSEREREREREGEGEGEREGERVRERERKRIRHTSCHFPVPAYVCFRSLPGLTHPDNLCKFCVTEMHNLVRPHALVFIHLDLRYTWTGIVLGSSCPGVAQCTAQNR